MVGTSRCHTKDGVFIPGCWGGVMYGKAGCYCRADIVPRENLQQAARDLLASAKRLEAVARRILEKK